MADVCCQTCGDATRHLGDQLDSFISLHGPVSDEVYQRTAGRPLADDCNIGTSVVTGLEDVEHANQATILDTRSCLRSSEEGSSSRIGGIEQSK